VLGIPPTIEMPLAAAAAAAETVTAGGESGVMANAVSRKLLGRRRARPSKFDSACANAV